ncbi:FAD-dependent oxidoreductase [Methanotorris formicicus]|uniref:FAD-dependent pyridine nucleotide-disulfide oxidoreductase n=1 Tax=Methanotorris formicicus Mc-S-70 TaxID=647171 RepID=H1KXY7_9EURY|nr:FAD-dependent oxidoreductase [Methanotorris formicicus]EHP87771.1 FAD-dependent pyridine nucleotide-disulfide oxidoreductase [Methanotorris formicicus Mc-S-70]
MVYKIAVVGGGPSGRISSMELAKKGFDVELYEKDKIGGTCLNYGCTYITGLREMADIIENLNVLKNEKIKLEDIISFKELQKKISKIQDKIRDKLKRETEDAGVSIKNEEFKEEYEKDYDYVVYATGRKISNPYDEGFLTYKDIPLLKELPERVLIVGGSVVAAEYAPIFSTFGSEVVVYARSKFLKMINDEDIRDYIYKKIVNFKIVEGNEKLGNKLINDDFDAKIIAIGGRTRFQTDEYLRVIGKENVYACGDCVKGGLTPIARMEGRVVANNIFNEINNKNLIKPNYNLIPYVIRMSLNIAVVGEITKRHETLPNPTGKENYFKVLNKNVGMTRIYYESGRVVGAITISPISEVVPYFTQYIKGIDVYDDFREIHPSTDAFYKMILG